MRGSLFLLGSAFVLHFLVCIAPAASADTATFGQDILTAPFSDALPTLSPNTLVDFDAAFTSQTNANSATTLAIDDNVVPDASSAHQLDFGFSLTDTLPAPTQTNLDPQSSDYSPGDSMLATVTTVDLITSTFVADAPQGS